MSLSFSNDSIADQPPSCLAFRMECLLVQPGSFLFTTYTIALLLILLPLCVLIHWRGLQRWRQQQTFHSHSDSFSYHLVSMDLCHIFGSILCCCGIYSNNCQLLLMWFYPYCFALFGKIFFHNLTCLEHYLAVVYPMTYLSLKSDRGIRIRNLIIGCIWLICFGLIYMMNRTYSFVIINIFLLSLSIVFISFCSLSVLLVLVRPGPGEQDKDRVRVHQSKQKAFYTIIAILGLLLLRCVWSLVWSGSDAHQHDSIDKCVGVMCEIWINFPSSLVLPVLFLQRARVIPCLW